MAEPAFQRCDISHQGLGVPVSYFIRPGRAGTLIYLHGLGASKGDFLEAARHQGLRDYTLLAFDFPGFGETPYPAECHWSMGDLVQVTDLLTVALNLTDPVIVGHSLGGLVGLMYALRYPGKVKGLVSIEGNLAPEDCFLTRAAARQSFPEFAGSRHLENLKLKFATAPDKGTSRWAAGLERGSLQAFYNYSISAVDLSDNGELLGIFCDLPIPKMFVYGSANNHLSSLTRLRQSDASVVEVPGSGHWPQVENPGYFYRALGGFLSERDPWSIIEP